MKGRVPPHIPLGSLAAPVADSAPTTPNAADLAADDVMVRGRYWPWDLVGDVAVLTRYSAYKGLETPYSIRQLRRDFPDFRELVGDAAYDAAERLLADYDAKRLILAPSRAPQWRDTHTPDAQPVELAGIDSSTAPVDRKPCADRNASLSGIADKSAPDCNLIGSASQEIAP